MQIYPSAFLALLAPTTSSALQASTSSFAMVTHEYSFSPGISARIPISPLWTAYNSPHFLEFVARNQ